MKSYFTFILLNAILFSTSCGSSCDEASLNAAYSDVESRGIESFADPTNKAKCQAYVNALENCIDEMENCDIDPTQIESYQNSLDSAKEDCK